jgi:hypothetical protein
MVITNIQEFALQDSTPLYLIQAAGNTATKVLRLIIFVSYSEVLSAAFFRCYLEYSPPRCTSASGRNFGSLLQCRQDYNYGRHLVLSCNRESLVDSIHERLDDNTCPCYASQCCWPSSQSSLSNRCLVFLGLFVYAISLSLFLVFSLPIA